LQRNSTYRINRSDVRTQAVRPADVGFSYSVRLARLKVGMRTITVVATDSSSVPNSVSQREFDGGYACDAGTKAGVARAGNQFLQDRSGNRTVGARDRFLASLPRLEEVLAGDIAMVGD